MARTTFQDRLQDDLRGVLEGEVYCDEVRLQLYSTDASMLESRPLGVVYPRTVEDVSATIRYASEKGISIHCRGAGTRAVGGAIGSGLIFDFSRYMRQVVQVDEETVLVEPGVIRERLNYILRTTKNRFFAPSSGHFPTCSLGSLLATDCAGPRWLAHRFPHDYVKELEIVTADGSIHHLRPEQFRFSESGVPLFGRTMESSALNREETPWRSLVEILLKAAPFLAEEQRSDQANRSGYRLEGVLRGDIFDPARLFLGSEGSLAVITRAIVQTIPCPPCSGAIIFLFDSLDKAARSVATILKSEPTLCDLLDRRIINMVREWDQRFQPILPTETEVALVVELTTTSPSELNDRMTRLVTQLRNADKLSFGSWFAIHQVERELFRELLRKAQGALLRIRPPFQIVTLLEDVQVPVEALPQFLHSVQNVLKNAGMTYSLSGHVGQGQVRILPIVEPSKEDIPSLMMKLGEELFEEVFKVGGSIGSAEGTGLVRSMMLPRRYPRLFPFFQEIKKLFDPTDLLNPGCVVELPRTSREMGPDGQHSESTPPAAKGERNLASLWTERMRKTIPVTQTEPLPANMNRNRTAQEQLKFQLRWDPQAIQGEVFQCTGCGLCRIRTTETRMCPTFRFDLQETATCRAKANLLRGVLLGELDLETMTLDQVKAIGDECIFCHCCTQECPAQTDIPKLAFRIKSAWYAAHGFSLSDRLLLSFDSFLEMASYFVKPLNLMLTKKTMRWLLFKLLGIPLSRKLPRLASKPFLSQHGRRKQSRRSGRRQNRRLALFVDTYSNYFDVLLAEAAVQILEHNGVDVYVPPHQRSSGHLAFTLGDIDRADATVQRNTAIFTDLVRQGYEILTIEPLSAVCIRQEYPYVRDDEETRLFSEHTTDICSFLYQLHREGALQLDFTPVHATIGYHAPCRTLALTGESVTAATPAEELLCLIPGLNVLRLERGCCGLAGADGIQRNNLHRSVRLGRRLFMALRDPMIQFGSTECNACKMQMEQGANKPTIHPVKLLAFAYGLMPELAALLDNVKSTDRIT